MPNLLYQWGAYLFIPFLLSLLAQTNAFAVTTIDNFNEGLFDSFIGSAGGGSNSLDTGLKIINVVGGARFVDLTFENGTGGINGQISNGNFTYLSSSNANGALVLAYFDNGTLNLNISSEAQFHLRFADFNFAGGQSMTVRVSVSDPLAIFDVDRSLGQVGPQDLFFPFSAFGPVNFSRIEVIQIFLQPHSGQTFALDFFQAEAAGLAGEPNPLVLLILGLVALLLWQRPVHS